MVAALGGALLCALVGTPRPAEAVVVERVVAVVAEKAILLTDLRKRLKPVLVQLHRQIPPGPQRAAAESKYRSQMIERMVEEELENLAAVRSSTTVTSEEVDKAMERVAAFAGLTVPQMLDNIRAQSGVTEQEYREEIRRQVLEGKLVQRLVPGPPRYREAEVRATYDKLVQKELRVRLYNPAWIVLQVGKNPSHALLELRRKLAESIVERAREGADFGSLAQQYSDDLSTSPDGGDLGVHAPIGSPPQLAGKYPALDEPLEEAFMGLQPGQVSAPVRYKDAIVVLALVSRQPSRYASYEDAKDDVMQRLQNEELQKAKEKWLKQLRRRTHVEIRL